MATMSAQTWDLDDENDIMDTYSDAAGPELYLHPDGGGDVQEHDAMSINLDTTSAGGYAVNYNGQMNNEDLSMTSQEPGVTAVEPAQPSGEAVPSLKLTETHAEPNLQPVLEVDTAALHTTIQPAQDDIRDDESDFLIDYSDEELAAGELLPVEQPTSTNNQTHSANHPTELQPSETDQNDPIRNNATNDQPTHYHDDNEVEHTFDHTHSVIIEHENDFFTLFDHDPAVAQYTDSFYLQAEDSIPLQDLFQFFRSHQDVEAGPNDWLSLFIPALDLRVKESDTPLTQRTLFDLVELYLRLHSNDGNFKPPPLCISLEVNTSIHHQFERLQEVVDAGHGLSQCSFLKTNQDQWLRGVSQHVSPDQDESFDGEGTEEQLETAEQQESEGYQQEYDEYQEPEDHVGSERGDLQKPALENEEGQYHDQQESFEEDAEDANLPENAGEEEHSAGEVYEEEDQLDEEEYVDDSAKQDQAANEAEEPVVEDNANVEEAQSHPEADNHQSGVNAVNSNVDGLPQPSSYDDEAQGITGLQQAVGLEQLDDQGLSLDDSTKENAIAGTNPETDVQLNSKPRLTDALEPSTTTHDIEDVAKQDSVDQPPSPNQRTADPTELELNLDGNDTAEDFELDLEIPTTEQGNRDDKTQQKITIDEEVAVPAIPSPTQQPHAEGSNYQSGDELDLIDYSDDELDDNVSNSVTRDGSQGPEKAGLVPNQGTESTTNIDTILAEDESDPYVAAPTSKRMDSQLNLNGRSNTTQDAPSLVQSTPTKRSFDDDDELDLGQDAKRIRSST